MPPLCIEKSNTSNLSPVSACVRFGRMWGDGRKGYYVNVCDVYTVDGGMVNRIIECYPNDEYYTINTHSVKLSEGNIFGTITDCPDHPVCAATRR